MPRLNLERLQQYKEETSSSGLGEMGSTALRYMDRAGRLAGLGVGTLGALATAPLQLIPGVTDWLPEVDEISNAYKAFTDLRRQGDWDAAISAAQDQLDAGPGYWGASEILGSLIPTGGPALAGSKLISAAPKLGRAAPMARGLGKAMRAPWEAEEFVGRQALRPITAGIGGLRGLASRFRGQQTIPDTGEQLRMFPDEVDEILNGEVVIDPIPDTGPIDIDTMSGGTRRPIAPTMTADELIEYERAWKEQQDAMRDTFAEEIVPPRDPRIFPEQWSTRPVYQGPQPGVTNQQRINLQEMDRFNRNELIQDDFLSRSAGDNPFLQAQTARSLKPIATGKQALLSRLDMEVRLKGVPQNVADAATRWLNMLPDEYLDDLGSSYLRKLDDASEDIATLGIYRPGDMVMGEVSPSIINISRTMLSDARDAHRTIIHEVSHHLEDFVSPEDLAKLRNQFAEEYRSRGENIKAEVVRIKARRDELGKEFRNYTAEEYQTMDDAYRYENFHEWFAEVLTDKALRDMYMEIPEYSGIIGRVMAQIRMMAQATRRFISDVLGNRDEAERVYKKIIDGNYSVAERNSLRRAPRMPVRDPGYSRGTVSRLAQDVPDPQMRLDPEDAADQQMRLFDVDEVPNGKEVPIKTYTGDVRRGLGSSARSVASLGITGRAVNAIGSFLDAVGARKLDAKNWFAPRTTAVSGAVSALFKDVRDIDIQVASHANRMRVWAGENKKVFTLDKDDRILDPALQNKVSGEDLIVSPTIQDLVARLDVYADDLTDAQRKFVEQLRVILEQGTSWSSGVDMPGWNQVLREVIPGWDPKFQRADISGSGFYITRGRAKGGVFGNQGFDESKIIMKQRTKTTPEYTAEARSMDGAIQTGAKYDSFEDALSHHISETGNRITGTIGGKEGYIGQRLGAIAARTKTGLGGQTARDVPGMTDYLDGDIPIDDELGRAFQRELKKRSLQQPDRQKSLAQSFNQVYRSMKATGDLSHIGIQGLLAMYRNTPAWLAATRFGIKGFIKGSKVEADFIRSFDEAAQESGMVTSDIWASFGLRIGGTESEYAVPGVGRIAESGIPGIRQIGAFFENANISFGTFGDTLRLGWAQSILKAEMAGGRSLDDLIQSGDLKQIADIANKMTGWSDTSFASTTFGADLGNLLLFAPRYFQSRLDTLGRAIEGTARMAPGVKQTIQGREASRAVWSMIGMGVTSTLMINEALGKQTDTRPLINGRYNPNFMRVRAGDQDVSLFGTWDSLLRMTILAAGGVTDPGKIADAYRGMSSGAVRAVWDNLTGYTFTGERTPFNSASPEEIAMYLGDLTLPISFLQAGDPLGGLASTIPDIARGEEGAIGEAASNIFGVAGEMTGVRLTPLSRTDRYDEVAQELYGSTYRDLQSDRKEQQVRKVTTERFGEAAYRGPEGPLRKEADDAEKLHQANVAEITQSYLSGEFGVGNWDPKRARREIRISMAEMIDDLDRAYSKLYPGSVREEPDPNTPEHLVWQYEEMFRQNRDSKGRLLYDQLEEAETGFWSKLSQQEVDYVLENIRDTEGLYPDRAQQMRQASRFLNNFKLNIRGENISYWDLDEHPLVAQRLTRVVSPGISPENVQRFLSSTSTERNGLLQGGERRIFVAIEKEYGKLFRSDGIMTALRQEFIQKSRQSEFPLWDVVMSTWDYQYPGDDAVRDVIEQWAQDGRFSIDKFDFDALYRQTLGQDNNAALVGR